MFIIYVQNSSLVFTGGAVPSRPVEFFLICKSLL